MRPRRVFSVSVAAVGLLSASTALAHIDLLEPEARAHGTAARGDTDVDVNSNVKSGPCGQVALGRTERVATYAPGQSITVRVREENAHVSYLRVSIDLDGTDFPIRSQVPAAPETQEEAEAAEAALGGGGLLAVVRENNDTPGFVHEIEVTLPEATCTNCTLQVIQFMYDDPAAPYYFQCADLVIADAGGSEQDAGGAPQPGGDRPIGTDLGASGALNPEATGGAGSANTPSATAAAPRAAAGMTPASGNMGAPASMTSAPAAAAVASEGGSGGCSVSRPARSPGLSTALALVVLGALLLAPPPLMLVSVLLPVFNASSTLAWALESIRRQRGVELECVAVDDGSTDGSLACLERFAAQDARLRVLSSEHRGIVAALNQGLEQCRGEYVARMDADDIMHSARLATQLAFLESHPELAGAGCRVRLFPRDGSSRARREYEQWLNSLEHARDVERELFVECPLAHPSWMLRRDVFRAFGYRDMGWPEDYDLLLRLVTGGHALGIVPRRLLSWRDSAARLSRRSEVYSDAAFSAAKAHFLARSWLARQRRYILWGYGNTGRALCRALLRHDRHPHAIIEVHPGRLGQRIQGAPVVAPEALLEARRSPDGDLPIVVSVAHAGPRNLVRSALEALQLRELVDYVCAA